MGVLSDEPASQAEKAARVFSGAMCSTAGAVKKQHSVSKKRG